MRVEVTDSSPLFFDDGSPVRAASAIAPFGDGWLIAQDDATHAAWCRPGSVTRVRVVDPVEGLDEFSTAEGTKHLKPDFEAAVPVRGGQGVLLLGSGSTPARMRASLVMPGPVFTVADLSPVYRAVAAALALPEDTLNLEGACQVGDRLRWFQRANAASNAPTACVDVDLTALLATVTAAPPNRSTPPAATPAARTPTADTPPPDHVTATVAVDEPVAVADVGPVSRIEVSGVRRYEIGALGGVALAVTDAVALGDGRVLVSAAAEDTPNAVDDGPVTGAALVLLGDDRVLGSAAIPGADKIEGLAIREHMNDGLRLIAVVDADDPTVPSKRLDLRLHW